MNAMHNMWKQCARHRNRIAIKIPPQSANYTLKIYICAPFNQMDTNSKK